jgi:uncharacterized OB-fold protein
MTCKKKIKCKSCDAVYFELVTFCPECGGFEFETMKDMRTSPDKNVYQDENIK